ncbi:hypothetical protein GQ42DRAFT_166052, partial [Ramicandelaber brevisporus]
MKVFATVLALAAACAAVLADEIPCGSGVVNGKPNPLCPTSYVNYYLKNFSTDDQDSMGRCEYDTKKIDNVSQLTADSGCTAMWAVEPDQVNCVVPVDLCQKIKTACGAFGDGKFHP